MEADGSDPVRLTTSKNADVMPSWSPDETRLVYASAVDQEHNGDVCVINADSTGLRNLTNTPDVSEYVPSLSPDGTRIVCVGWESGDNRIQIMDGDGETHRELISNGLWPSWSADGDQIVFVSDRNSSGTELWTSLRTE